MRARQGIRPSLRHASQRLHEIHYAVDVEKLNALRHRDLLALALWLLPPWVVIGFFAYAWLVVDRDLAVMPLALYAAVYAGVRVFCRLMMLTVLCGLGVVRRAGVD